VIAAGTSLSFGSEWKVAANQFRDLDDRGCGLLVEYDSDLDALMESCEVEDSTHGVIVRALLPKERRRR
jgi:hypothetical protein